jgi:hypothetical protein
MAGEWVGCFEVGTRYAGKHLEVCNAMYNMAATVPVAKLNSLCSN